ncbi:hypothetical protein Tco_0644568 [Tanacetum coccineum]
MIMVSVTIKILVITNLHFILRIRNNSLTVVRSVEVPIIALIIKLGTNLSMSLILDLDSHSHFMLLAREIDEFIKSSVDGLVPISRESELTLDSTDLECSMLIDPPLPCTDVLGDTIVDINLPLGEHLDTLSTGDREIDLDPIRDIEELERLLVDDPVPVPRVFDEPLGNSDSLFDEEFEDISSLDPPKSTLVIDESSLLVTPLPDPKQICLREVERFNPFFSLTQSGGTTWVMERPSYRCSHMPSPRPAAYSPKEVIDQRVESKCVRMRLKGETRGLHPLADQTGDPREENFDINSPLVEYVVDFLIENEDVAGLPRHLVKYLFNHLLKNPSLTKEMSDEPLGDDSKPRSYDVTFSNPLFDFNDDSTLCYNNPLFDEEFEDISSLDPLSRL